MMTLIASILLKVKLTAVAGLLFVYLAPRHRASVRHAALAASFAVLLALPLAALVFQSVGFAVPVVVPRT